MYNDIYIDPVDVLSRDKFLKQFDCTTSRQASRLSCKSILCSMLFSYRIWEFAIHYLGIGSLPTRKILQNIDIGAEWGIYA